MATARKLPSGSWRCRVYVGEENGKKIYKSFTAGTKKQAEFMASQYLVEDKPKTKSHSNDMITFLDALDNYIEAKSNVLSPSTIAGYMGLRKRFALDHPYFSEKKVCNITQDDVQKLINTVASKKSPKTVRNYHGLISSVLKPYTTLNTTMPQKIEPELYIPSDDEIKKLLSAIENTEMEIPVLLGAFCMMRRGEICGLNYDTDIKGTTIHIHHSLVIGTDNKWHLKAPKTKTSDRYIEVEPFIINKINEKGYVTNLNPNQITQRLRRIQTKHNIPYFRFHDLRHYSASIRHALGIPDAYIMADGGWKSDHVLKSVYRHAMDNERSKMQSIANAHFSKLYDTKYDTNN